VILMYLAKEIKCCAVCIVLLKKNIF